MVWTVMMMTLAFITQANPQASVPSDIHCGSYCLYVGLKALDVPISDYQSLEAELGQPGPLGYSMEQLAEVSRKHGLYAEGVVTDLETLAYLRGRFICIALLDRGHFVNIYDFEEDKVYLIDPPGKRPVSADAFKALWSGKVLLVSQGPLPTTSAFLPWYRRRTFVVGLFAFLLVLGLIIWRYRAIRS